MVVKNAWRIMWEFNHYWIVNRYTGRIEGPFSLTVAVYWWFRANIYWITFPAFWRR